MKDILVLGGTGVLGSALVRELQAHQVTFLIGSRTPVKTNAYGPVSPSPAHLWRRVDLATGQGLAEACAGIDTVFHLATGVGKVGAEPFETVATRHVLAAARQAGVQQVVYSSIVGVDKIPFGYYKAKLAAENLIRQSDLPHTILRATQFHPFIAAVLGKLLLLPVGLVPKELKAQPIDAQAVARHLLLLAQRGGEQTTTTIAGPEIFTLDRLAQLWLAQRKQHKLILNIPTLGAVMRGFARGDNTSPAHAMPSKTWAAYLAQSRGSTDSISP